MRDKNVSHDKPDSSRVTSTIKRVSFNILHAIRNSVYTCVYYSQFIGTNMTSCFVWSLTCFLWLATGLSGALALAALDVHLDSSPGGGKYCLWSSSVYGSVLVCRRYGAHIRVHAHADDGPS